MVRLLIFSSVLFLYSMSGIAAPSNFSYQGQIVKPNGQPLEGNSVTFTIEILSPGAEQCLLYQETHTLNMLMSNGIFALEVGSGNREASPDYEDVTSLADALDNAIGLVTPTTCASVGNYTAVASDSRKLRLTFDDGSGPQTITNDHNIVSVPFANSASSIDGITSGEILRNNNTVGNNLTQTNVEFVFNDANWAELQDLLDGSSASFGGAPSSDVNYGGNKITNLGNPTLAGDATNKQYVDGQVGGMPVNTADILALGVGEGGEVLTWSGTQWESTAIPADATKLNRDGTNAMTGDLDVGTNDITNVTNITASGAVSANGLSTGTTLAIYNADTSFMGFQAAAGSADLVWTLPNADGSNGQLLSTNGGGTLSWASVSAANVSSTATGNIIATNVDAAIAELEAEKLALAGGNMSGAIVMDNENEIRFRDNDNSHYVGFKAPANISAAGSFVWELPVDDGANGQVLRTNGSGQLSWVDQTSVVGSALTSANFWVGDGSNQAAAVTMGGDASMNNAGSVTIANNAITSGKINDGEIVNADINAAAAIDRSKLATGTVNRALINDGSGNIAASAITDTELGYLDGVSSNIQTQLNSKLTIGGDSKAATVTVGTNDTQNFAIETDGTTRMTIDSTGNLGVGTDAPSDSLSVIGTFSLSRYSNTAGEGPGVARRRARGTIGTPAVVQDGDNLGDLRFQGYSAAFGDFRAAANIQAKVDGDPDTASDPSDMPGRLEFITTPDGGGTGVVNMVIKNDGNIGIGTETPSGKLDVEGGDVFFGITTLDNPSGNEDLVVRGNIEADGAFYGDGSNLTGVLTSESQSLDDAYNNGSSVTVDSTDVVFNLSSTQDFHIQDSGGAVFTVLDSGNVGIGTATPGAPLHIESSNFRAGYVSGTNASATSFHIENLNAGANTGWEFAHSATSSSLLFTEQGLSTRMAIAPGGNVGIGTTNPSNKLTILGDTSQYSGSILVGDSGSAGGSIAFGNNSHGLGRALGDYGTNELIMYNGSGSMHFATTSTPFGYPDLTDSKLTITNSGNVGVGTTNPLTKLQVNQYGANLGTDWYDSLESVAVTGDDSRLALVSRDSSYWGSMISLKQVDANVFENAWGIGRQTNGDGSGDGSLRFLYGTDSNIQNNTTHMAITSDGNVGIGTTTPISSLDVHGTIRVNKLWVGRDGAGSDGGLEITNDTGSVSYIDFKGNGNEASNFQGRIAYDDNQGFLFRTNADSTNRLTIHNSGNVGIGTNNPGGKLDVDGDIRMLGGTSGYTGFQAPATAPDLVYTLPATAPAAGQILSSTVGGVTSWIDNASGADDLGDHTATTNIQLGSNWLSGDGGSEGIFVNASGNVGVGTNNPTFPLEVNGTGKFAAVSVNAGSSAAPTVSVNNAGGLYSPASNEIAIVSSAAERIRVDSTGDVGIGTTAPTQKLDVEGSILSGPKGTAANDGGAILLEELATNGTNVTGFRAPNDVGVADIIYTLPGTAPAAGQILSSSAAGVMSWIDNASGADDLGDHTATTNIQLGSNWLSGDGGNEGVFVNASGNVGIGTNAPANQLDLTQSENTGAGVVVNVNNTNAGANAWGGFQLSNDSGADGWLWLPSSGYSSTWQRDRLVLQSDAGDGIDVTAAAAAGDIRFYTGSNAPANERMRIDQFGNVMIGTTDPQNKLVVASASASAAQFKRTEASGSSGFTVFDFSRENSSAAGVDGMTVQFTGRAETKTEGVVEALGGIRFSGTDMTAGSVDSTFSVINYLNGAVQIPFFIDSSGNVGIGTNTPAVELDIDTGVINAASICDESNGNCIDLSAGVSSNSASTTTNYVINTDSDNLGSDGGVSFQTNAATVAAITPAGRIQANAGSVGFAGLTFLGDEDTGLYAPAANTLSATAGGVEGLRINNVASGVNYVELSPATTGNGPIIAAGGTDTNIDLNISPKGTGDTIFTNGRVGIGTATPDSPLTVRLDQDAGTPISVYNADAGTSAVASFFASINPADTRYIDVGIAGVNYSDVNYRNRAYVSAGPNTDGLHLATGGADPILVSTNSTERLRIDSSGNLGLGTTTPGQKLDVEGRILSGPAGTATGQTGSILMEELATNGTNVTGFRAPDDVGVSDIIYTLPGTAPAAGQILSSSAAGVMSWIDNASGADDLGDHTATTNIQLGSNWLSGDGGNEGVFVNASGNVGIGTTAPSDQLTIWDSTDLSGSDATEIVPMFSLSRRSASRSLILGRDSQTNENAIVASHNSDLRLGRYHSSDTPKFTEYMVVQNTTGNVGVGTTAPSQKLDVEGAVLSGPSGTGAGQGGSIRFEELAANGTNVVGFRAPDSLAGDVIWQLPIADGTSGQVLQTDGSGILSWVSLGGGGDFLSNGSVAMSGNLNLGGNDIINLGQGTVSAPSLSFTGSDTNTGLWSPAGDTIALSTGGNEALRVDSSGRVGIGTTNPNRILDVYIPNGGIASGIRQTTLDSSGIFLQYKNSDGEWKAGMNNSENFIIEDMSAGQTRMIIDNNGNVGIGTNNPAGKLDVDGDIRMLGGTSGYTGFQAPATAPNLVYTLPVTAPAAGQILSSTAGGVTSWIDNASGADDLGDHTATTNIQLGSNWLSGDGGSEGIYIDAAGNVGIGTNLPLRTLEVYTNETNTAGNRTGIRGDYRVSPSGAATGNYSGFEQLLNYNSASNVSSPGRIIGASIEARRGSSGGDVDLMVAFQAEALDQGAGTIAEYIAGDFNLTRISGSGTITNAKVIDIEIDDGGGTITNGYGIYLNDVVATNDYGFYQVGADDTNYFAGNIGIGTNNPGGKLDVDGDIRMLGGTSGYTGFQAPATAPDLVYTLPATAPAAGQILSSTAGGVTSWIDNASGADDLGDHTATTNIQLSDNWLSNDGGAEGIRITDAGLVGIGTATPSENLSIEGDAGISYADSSTTGNQSALDIGVNLSGSVTGAGNNRGININYTTNPGRTDVKLIGLDTYMYIGNVSDELFGTENFIQNFNGVSGTNTKTVGTYNEIEVNGSSYTSTDAIGTENYVRTDSSGTITNAYGSRNLVLEDSGFGGITNAYAVFADVDETGTDLVNGYGLYIGDIAGTNDYGVYQFGANDTNYFAGNVGIGTNAPAGKLDVDGDIRMLGGTSGYTGFEAPATAPNLVYTLPVTAPAAGQILSSDASGILSWIAAGGSGDFLRDGSLPMTGQLQLLSSNDAGNPELTFDGDEDTGIYQSAADQMNFSVGGTNMGYFSSTGFTVNETIYADDINLNETSTATSGTLSGGNITMSAVPTAASTLDVSGLAINSTTMATLADSTGETIGLYVGASGTPGGGRTVANVVGTRTVSSNTNTGTVTEAIAGDFEIGSNAGTITTAYGVKVTRGTTAGTVGTNYGVYLDDIFGTNDYGIYQTGTDDVNYFAGKVGIGTNNPLYNLVVDENSTNASYIQITNNNTASNGATIGTDVDNDFAIINWETGEDIEFATQGSFRGVIDHTGAYGIGTMEPSAILDVVGDAALLPGSNAAPADAVLDNSQWTLWLDEASDEFELKAKKSDGSVITQTVGAGGAADDLGDHTATTNIQLNDNYLSNDGGAEGIRINNSGDVGIGDVAGTGSKLFIRANTGTEQTGLSITAGGTYSGSSDTNGLLVTTTGNSSSTGDYVGIANSLSGNIGNTSPVLTGLQSSTLALSTTTTQEVVGADISASVDRNASNLTAGRFLAASTVAISAGTVTEALAGDFTVEVANSDTIATAYGVRSSINDTSTGSITTGYGVYISDVVAGTDYGVYQVGADDVNYFAGNVGIGTNAPAGKLDVDGDIRMLGSTSGYTGFQAPAAAPSLVYTLPATAPAAGQILESDGSGVLSWVAAPSGADDLGDHTATTNIQLGSNYLNNDGGATEGLAISASGMATLRANSGSQNVLYMLNDTSSAGSGNELLFANGSFVNMAYIRQEVEATTSDAALSFATRKTSGSPAERMRITSDGNVGIGVSDPSSVLSIAAADSTNSKITASSYAANSTMTLRRANNTQASPTIVTSANILGQLNFSGYDGDEYHTGASIRGQADGAPGDNDMPGRLIFATTPDGSSTPVERVRIDNSGNVGIGTNDPSTKLQVNGADEVLSITDSSRSGASAQAYLAFRDSLGALTGYIGDGSTGTSNLSIYTANTLESRADSGYTFNVNGGANALTINGTSGNVGIGTTAPSEKLHIESGALYFRGFLNETASVPTTDSFRIFQQNDSANGDPFGTGENSSIIFENQDSSQVDPDNGMYFFNTGNDNNPEIALSIKGNGNVGIGTTNPLQALHVYGDARFQNRVGFSSGTEALPSIRYYNSPDTGLYFPATDTIALVTNALEAMRVDASGNVGIGTTSPDADLHVNGEIRGAASVSNGTRTVDFSSGNIQHTTLSCSSGTPFELHNMGDGGSYTLIVKGTTSDTCAFNTYSDAGTTGLTEHLPPDHGATEAGKHTIYTILVSGGDVYFSFVPGY